MLPKSWICCCARQICSFSVGVNNIGWDRVLCTQELVQSQPHSFWLQIVYVFLHRSLLDWALGDRQEIPLERELDRRRQSVRTWVCPLRNAPQKVSISMCVIVYMFCGCFVFTKIVYFGAQHILIFKISTVFTCIHTYLQNSFLLKMWYLFAK